jgi:PAS domain S-box-containing protein
MMLVEDLPTHPLFQNASVEWLKVTGAIAGFPLKIGERVVGVMNISYRHRHRFHDSEVQMIRLLASHASIAIENARLYQEVSDYANQLADRVRERTRELERERAQLQAILDSMGEGVIYDEQHEIKYSNRALTDMTGYPDNPWQDYADLLHTLVPNEEAFAALQVQIEEAIQRQWQDEIMIQRADGSTFDASIVSRPVIDAHGEPTGAVTIIQDISAAKALQEQKDRFIAHASHELRTPLANLRTRLYLIKRQPNKQKYHLEVMDSVAAHMTELVEELLDISRFERGLITLQPEWCIIQDFLNYVYEVQQPEAQKKNLSFFKSWSAEPLQAFVDGRRLRQVVTNLVVNAINYTPEGGRVEIRLVTDDAHFEIQVEDTGQGIAEEHQTQIFQPFFRATQGAELGTGLGLAIADQIVKMHGGEILLTSEVGKGSLFRVRLPVQVS